jgi:hypothetical protein
MSPIYTPGKVVLRKTWQPMDADAAAYITAVETADGQALEEKVKIAIDNFILGCKADSIWNAIKASCILAGARTLNGALVPLVGTAPTNYNFVAGDYNRETGLAGNGSTKCLDSNRNNNSDPQNSKHLAVYATTHHDRSISRAVIGSGGGVVGDSHLLTTTTGRLYRANYSSVIAVSDTSTAPGFWGVSRSTASTVVGRYSQANVDLSCNSIAPTSGNILVFSRGSVSSLSTPSNARLAFYSIGESLDLAKLDARVTDLINAFGAAIP